jgi:crotonobetainyl-CoA:carnitine CoA-transferase CaiB-like acyl-CoA transferase
LREICQARLRERPTAEWVTLMNDAGVPCGPVLKVDEVFADPQVKHLGMAADVVSPHLGPMQLVRTPFDMSRTPPSVRTAAPAPGEHTRDVLTALGLSVAEIEELAAEGVIEPASAAAGSEPRAAPAQ